MRSDTEKRVLIIGAGEAGRMVASEIVRHEELNERVVGFLDDALQLAGAEVDSIPVLGRTDELEKI
ncbi:MAG: polysaccharide biosynthesis protein, partial [Candidatus Krumholzibacteria bacterium]|nr:polysaccharide biosynthesis protein [Candidatus Krumholzibacteria bacterium]